ncbi:MAG: LytTR family transcriptional regulator [Eubacteriales bacterium]|nr:LytTR family transcriptional regulator [Eubacteriales bacterium]
MKVTLRREPGAEKEIVVRYDVMDDEVHALLELLSLREKRLAVDDGGALRLLDPPEILYCESVDDHTYAYTASGVFGVGQTLSAIAEAFTQLGFLRCSKSMAVNLHAIEALKSGDNGRIFATLANGEHILVSRRYAKALRDRLKGE